VEILIVVYRIHAFQGFFSSLAVKSIIYYILLIENRIKQLLLKLTWPLAWSPSPLLRIEQLLWPVYNWATQLIEPNSEYRVR
jgi:hypothetical protein